MLRRTNVVKSNADWTDVTLSLVLTKNYPINQVRSFVKIGTVPADTLLGKSNVARSNIARFH